tara:strand:+ start:352 stop:852 length:501 start_codon:yes stop_codon:yes gene_type:complete
MHSYDTLFLDRDGVINKKLDGKYVKDFSEFEFIDGVKSAISELTNIFKRILIVTNQQGIGKKIMSDADLNLLHSRMVFELNKYGGIIDKIYFCPDLETKKCNCRKPGTKMFENALNDFPNIKIERSYMIGDSKTDIIAGNTMGLNTVLVSNNYTLNDWLSDLKNNL